jgi:hypothetical protein
MIHHPGVIPTNMQMDSQTALAIAIHALYECKQALQEELDYRTERLHSSSKVQDLWMNNDFDVEAKTINALVDKIIAINSTQVVLED